MIHDCENRVFRRWIDMIHSDLDRDALVGAAFFQSYVNTELLH